MIGNRLRTLLMAITGALTVAPLLADGVAYRIKDLRTQVSEEHYLGGGLTAIDLGAMVYLDFLNLGREPWITDGTLAGTRLMANLAPGSMGSDPVEVGKIGATVFLAATTPGTGRELWRTNGRAWGTAQVMDIRPGPEGSDPAPFGVLGDAILFVADDGVHGRELWRSDGTTAGTWLLADVWPGPVGSLLDETHIVSQELNGRVLFTGSDESHGRELWVTDGTPAGTGLLLDIVPGPSDSHPLFYLSFGDRIYFSAYDTSHGRELWVSDGTAAGTHVLVDLAPGAASSGGLPSGVAAHGLVFEADETGAGAGHPWVTDGTVQGTLSLSSVGGGAFGHMLGGRVLFTGYDATHGSELWVTDGTPTGTHILADLYPGAQGSNSGTAEVGRGRAYFCATDSATTDHLFTTDGTTSGTRRLDGVDCWWVLSAADVDGGILLNACWPEPMACPGCWTLACRLWRTDGTNAGTWSLYPGLRQVSSSDPQGLTPRADGILFSAAPGSPRCDSPYYYYFDFPFVSDGTEAGTSRVTGPGGSTVCIDAREIAPLPDGEVLFRGWEETTGSEPWATDASGAHLVRDIAEGPASSDPAALARVGPIVYLGASDSASGAEPWTSDGSAGGTSLLVDILPGSSSSHPLHFTDVFGRAWFSAYTSALGDELYESWGTAASTYAHDLTPGPGSTSPGQITPLDSASGSLVFLSHFSLYSYVPGATQASFLKTISLLDLEHGTATLAVNGAEVYFLDANASGACELWTSDGTTAGTRVVTVIGFGYDRGVSWEMLPCPTELIAFADRLFFPACDVTHGCEIWTSDGTAAGTHLFADLEPGPGSSLPWSLTVIGEKLYFAGCRAASGCEPWVSDGTPAGTHRVADVALGPPSSDPYDFTLSGRLVYFGADDTTGTELWAMPVEIFYDGFETGDASRWDPPTP